MAYDELGRRTGLPARWRSRARSVVGQRSVRSVALVLVILSTGLGTRTAVAQFAAAAPDLARRTVVVVPFANISTAAEDDWLGRGIAESASLVDTEAVMRGWEHALGAPAWDGPPAWIHGDLAPDNMLLIDGSLSAVIDWGGLGVGDPATELLPAWNLFRGASREAYREALEFDDATWARGLGLALSTSIVALPYYKDTIPVRAKRAKAVIREVLADQERES